MSLFRSKILFGIVALSLSLGACLTPLCMPAPGLADETPPKPNFDIDQSTAAALAAKVDELVSKRFVDKTKVDTIWRPAFDAARQVLIKQTSMIDFATKMNELLALLHASHTQFYTENDEGFFFLRSLFGAFDKDQSDPNRNDADFTGLGVGGAQ